MTRVHLKSRRWSGNVGLTYQKLCVYTHSIGGVVFYVGLGTPVRPFTVSNSMNGRSAKWYEMVKGAMHFDVEIIGYYDDPQDARDKECELIELLEPVANVRLPGGKRGAHR